MVITADHRIDGLHSRVRELIEAATRERDYIRRQHLTDLAVAHEHVLHAFEAQTEKEKEASISRSHDEQTAKQHLGQKRRSSER